MSVCVIFPLRLYTDISVFPNIIGCMVTHFYQESFNNETYKYDGLLCMEHYIYILMEKKEYE